MCINILCWILSCALFFAQSTLFAEEPKEENSGIITLPAGKVVLGDYFAAGDNVEISGIVKGDVYVFANQVFVDGQIFGDVIVAAASVDISGDVAGNIRVLAGQTTISGNVGRNATVIAGNAQFISSAKILGNLVTVAGNMDLASPVDSYATIIASNLRVSSSIKNDLLASVGQMRITSRAQIGGNVDYRSNHPAIIDPDAKVGGKITQLPSFVHDIFKGHFLHKLLVGSKVAALLMNFFYTFCIGLILIKIFPKNLESALDVLKTQPWKALSFGLMLLILLPLASLILLMTILGVPFALTLIALNVIGFYTAKVFSIMWASEILFKKMGAKLKSVWILLFGLVIYFALVSIPFFGIALALVAMLFGLGAGVLGGARRKLLPKWGG